MPRFLLNWTFQNVVDFLLQHFFVPSTNYGGSHHYYRGCVDGADRMVEIQYHASNTIKPRCLQHDIIPKSGIPEEVWKKWANAGNSKGRKKVQYKGAAKKDN